MKRINVYSHDAETGEQTLEGWFDLDTAEEFKEDTRWNGSNHISRATGSQFDHQILYRTKRGRWVLHNWSQWQGSVETYEFVADEQAKTWLLENEHDAAVTKYFGQIEDERGPGRPEVGPAVNVRFPDPLLEQIDAAAKAGGVSRAEMIRRLSSKALNG